MISNPIYSSFRVTLPKNFIYNEVRASMQGYFKAFELPYADIADYLNSTITNNKIPGLRDDGAQQEGKGQGTKQRFRSGLLTSENITSKEITLTFKLKNSYLNYFILYRQMLAYMDAKKGTQGENAFMPDIQLHLLDDEDRIIVTMIYKEITFISLDDLDLRKQDNGIVPRDFDLVLGFNKFDLSFDFDKIQSNRDDELHVYP